MFFLFKIFGDANEKYIKRLEPIIEEINRLEKDFAKLSQNGLKEKTEELKRELAFGKTLDDVLAPAFALVREAAKRNLGQRPFDVQLIGGIVLHQGKVAEMKTGEGKTLAATSPAYLNALEGKGVHIVTVNDYLAKRDAVWMGQIYHFLGLSVSCINHDTAYIYDPLYLVQKKSQENEISNFQFPNYKQIINSNGQNDEQDKTRDTVGGFKVVESYLRPVSRKEAYAADITYGTNHEFGFDYLRDNMVYDLAQQVQRGFNFAIVDEVDSILIDEARVPLIISGQSDESTEKYYQFAKIASSLKEKEDYEIDEKIKTAVFTEQGQDKVIESLRFDPWQDNDINATHQLESSLRAKTLFLKDRDYVVRAGEIIIIDEFTGRMLPGRRWSSGLHQAVEAKEGVEIKPESLTLATITFQNYFRLYKKLSGMTGTAQISAEELDKVYKLDVVSIPTNKPMQRKNFSDRIYKTEAGKLKAVIRDIKELYEKGQPVLAGTRSVEKNEYLGKLLDIGGIPHQILNAKNHEREGEIIAQAGRQGAVTIATNMAGRGVDIMLGGSSPSKSKIQNPKFKINEENFDINEEYKKWEEEHNKVISLGGLHVIGTERHEARRIDDQLRGRSGRQGDPGSSQFYVSLEDDLMRIFGGDKIKSVMSVLKVPEDEPIQAAMISGAIESAQQKIEGFNFDARHHLLEYDDVMNKHREAIYKKRREILGRQTSQIVGTSDVPISPKTKINGLREYILTIIKKAGYAEDDYLKKEKEVGEENMRQIEKFVSLKVLDAFWQEHLLNMDYIRDSVRLRAYGGKDPLVEYKNESRKMFYQLLEEIDINIANAILKTSLPLQKGTISNLSRTGQKVGRNDPCPCGAKHPDGRPIKYKHCHGK
ncbi:MAG: preprotein translocase subunit SecA [Parcubacteria group bacterium Licking1014_1]|nr:MAG: preprotein translocase subunit SecA [Parcubacteria group bacterium Licking1014_1]